MPQGPPKKQLKKQVRRHGPAIGISSKKHGTGKIIPPKNKNELQRHKLQQAISKEINKKNESGIVGKVGGKMKVLKTDDVKTVIQKT